MADEQKPAAKAAQAAPHTHTATAKVEVEAEKVEEKPLERTTAQSFEVGGPENLYLAGGSAADLAYAQREEDVEKLRVEQGAAAAGNPPAAD